MADKKILIAVNSFFDAFENSLTNKAANIVYIKTADLKEWTENENVFVSKIFGDHESGMTLNFIYKEGDKEFEREYLEKKILEYKKMLFKKYENS